MSTIKLPILREKMRSAISDSLRYSIFQTLCCRLSTIEIVVDLGGIVALYGHQCIVPHLSGVLPEAIKYRADMLVVQLQQPNFTTAWGKSFPATRRFFFLEQTASTITSSRCSPGAVPDRHPSRPGSSRCSRPVSFPSLQTAGPAWVQGS